MTDSGEDMKAEKYLQVKILFRISQTCKPPKARRKKKKHETAAPNKNPAKRRVVNFYWWSWL